MRKCKNLDTYQSISMVDELLVIVLASPRVPTIYLRDIYKNTCKALKPDAALNYRFISGSISDGK